MYKESTSNARCCIKVISVGIIPHRQYFLQNVSYVHDKARQKLVIGKFITQLHKSTSCRHVHDTAQQKHVMSACSWHISTKVRYRQVHDSSTQSTLSFLSRLGHYSSTSSWESVRLYGKGFRYCPKQNWKSHKICGLRTHNGKVEEIKHRFATLTGDKS